MLLMLGCAAFALMATGDLIELKSYKQISKLLFFVGSVLLIVVTVLFITNSFDVAQKSIWILIIFLFLILLFLFLLIYSLFFAIPFNKVYIKEEIVNVSDKGMYSLCRHPGGIWFALLYVCLWLGLGLKWYVAVIFTVLNFLYITLQDIIIFPKTISGYIEYKSKVPFLIPTVKSIYELTVANRSGRHKR